MRKFFSLGLVRGLIWQILGTALGFGLFAAIQALLRQTFNPEPAWVLGGIIGALMDCHSNWTAAYHLMKRAGADKPPCTVTAEYSLRFRRPNSTS